VDITADLIQTISGSGRRLLRSVFVLVILTGLAIGALRIDAALG